MIENFEQLKKKIVDLADVINSFKSEAVQLRIVELIFQGSPRLSVFEAQKKPTKQTKQTRPTKAKKEPKRKPKRMRPEVKGKKPGISSSTVLTELIQEGFFKKSRTYNDIVKSCSKKSRSIKSKDLARALTRFAQDGRLKREKSDKGLYEYFMG